MSVLKVFFVFLAALAQLARGEKSEPLKNENICSIQPDGAIIANRNDCNKFYICVQEKPYEYNCDAGYHYDAATRQCLPGIFCSMDINKRPTCAEGNVRAVQNDCNIFEACVKGQYQKINCPPSYYFNVKLNICMPFKYDAQFKCNCLMPEYTVLENTDNCGTYFVCHRKFAILENCPQGQYYNAELNTCVNDLQGICLSKPTVTPGLFEDVKVNTTNDAEKNKAKTICKNLALKGIHFQTFPKGCNTFYICVNGKLYTQHCSKGFYYDSDKKLCIADKIKKCSQSGKRNVTSFQHAGNSKLFN